MSLPPNAHFATNQCENGVRLKANSGAVRASPTAKGLSRSLSNFPSNRKRNSIFSHMNGPNHHQKQNAANVGIATNKTGSGWHDHSGEFMCGTSLSLRRAWRALFPPVKNLRLENSGNEELVLSIVTDNFSERSLDAIKQKSTESLGATRVCLIKCRKILRTLFYGEND